MNEAGITIITGKGGVGKTSLIAAHALSSARAGARTLLVSADMAHNLGDIFVCRTGGGRVKTEENLEILELEPGRIMREEFPEVGRALMGMLAGRSTVPEAAGRFMIPGFENLFSLLEIRRLRDSGRYDRILVDCAPSGETLSLLKLPELLSWYMEKFFPVGKVMTRVLRPVAGGVFQVQLPDNAAMDEIARMHRELTGLQELLKDPEVTDVRLVCLPEKMVVEETKRTWMYLNLYGYHVDRVFINRVLDRQEDNPFLASWREIQQPCLEELKSVFRELPVTEIPWYETQILGIPSLERLLGDLPAAEELFAHHPPFPTEVYVPFEGEHGERGYCLRMHLPGTEAVQVRRFGQDLDLQTGNCLRRIPLPETLETMGIDEVRREEGSIEVRFVPSGNGGKGARI